MGSGEEGEEMKGWGRLRANILDMGECLLFVVVDWFIVSRARWFLCLPSTFFFLFFLSLLSGRSGRRVLSSFVNYSFVPSGMFSSPSEVEFCQGTRRRNGVHETQWVERRTVLPSEGRQYLS